MTDEEIQREAEDLAREIAEKLAGISPEDVRLAAQELFEAGKAWCWEHALALAWYRIAVQRAIGSVIGTTTRMLVRDALAKFVEELSEEAPLGAK